MASAEERIDIDLPVSTAYDQWTKFILRHFRPGRFVEFPDVPRHRFS